MFSARRFNLGRTIRAARKAKGLTLHALGKAAGLSPALLCLIENGVYTARREHIVLLANLMGASEDDWCLMAGQLSPKIESALIALANDNPALFDAIHSLALCVVKNERRIDSIFGIRNCIGTSDERASITIPDQESGTESPP